MAINQELQQPASHLHGRIDKKIAYGVDVGIDYTELDLVQSINKYDDRQ